jgi:hypothetical protein
MPNSIETLIPNTHSILATIDEEDVENPWTTVSYRKSRKERVNHPNSELIESTATARKMNKTRRYLNERQRKINMGYTLNYNNSGIKYRNYYDYLNYVVLRKHIKKETVGPEQLKQFQTKLVSFFRDGYNKYFNESNEPASDDVILDFINKQLIEHGIIISGGFVLKNLGYIKSDKEASSVDIDMYIPGNTPLSTYVLFGKLFNANIDETTNNGTATNDKSIMNRFVKDFYDVKNARKWQLKGIRSVTKFKRGIKDTPSYGEMDFVRAYSTKTDKHPLRTPEQIVNDFDLTFCENWYDGKNVYITHKKAILKEEPGFLKSTYLFSYLLGKNRMSVSRVKKYIQRGFRIIFVDPTRQVDSKNPYKIMEIKYIPETDTLIHVNIRDSSDRYVFETKRDPQRFTKAQGRYFSSLAPKSHSNYLYYSRFTNIPVVKNTSTNFFKQFNEG